LPVNACHDDFGLAVANFLGFRQGSMCPHDINGLGERTGSASLESGIAMPHNF